MVSVLQSDFEQGLARGQEILRYLGVNLPIKANRFHILIALIEIKFLLLKRNLSSLPLLKKDNPRVIAIASILSLPPSSTGISNDWVIMIKEQIALQLKYGLYSAIPYMAWAHAMIMNFKRVQKGYQLAELAIYLSSQCEHDPHHHFMQHMFYGMISPWQTHIQESIAKLHKNYINASQNGNLDVGVFSLFLSYLYGFFIGKNLSDLEKAFELEMKPNRNLLSLWDGVTMITIIWQTNLNLLYNPNNITALVGKAFDETKLPIRPSYYVIAVFSAIKLILSYLFYKYNEALSFARDFEKVSNTIPSMVTIATINFYVSLTKLALYDETKGRKLLKQVTKSQKKMKFWAKYAPMNYLHKWYLVEAEKYRVLGKNEKAWQHYQRAIDGAREHGFVNEEAIALELTARFFLNKNNTGLAGYYMRESYSAYVCWGAVAKLKQLEKDYPQLLIEPFSLQSISSQMDYHQYYSTKTEHSQLDIASLMEASQTLSSELKLDVLLNRLMKTLIENAGAQQGFLLLPSKDWKIVAHCKIDEEFSLKEIILEEATDLLPLSLIRFVIRSQEQVVLANASTSDYQQDSYISSKSPKSVMALPLIHQNQLVGVVYLENNLAIGAFSEDRIEVLTLLSSQAAISLQNALLLSEVQNKVTQLEISRKRLVQTEEKQRRDLAERLHSGVQSKLMAARLELQNSIKDLPEQMQKDMDKGFGLLEQVQKQDLSHVSYLLHPAVVKIGLIPAIESLLEEVGSNFKIKWYFDDAVFALDDPKDNNIPEELRLTIYRVVEEALLNIKKHAEATLVKVAITCDGENLCLEVTDNGCGFEEEKMQPHLGLHSIADRVSLTKGSWEIKSRLSQGTSLQAKLPLCRGFGEG